MCLDVAVKRAAECNTDHQLLRAKVRIVQRKRVIKKKSGVEGKRYEVSGLVRCKMTEDTSTGRSLQQDYIESVLEKAAAAWPEKGTVEEKWGAMRSALTTSADELLGCTKNRQPDWFHESMDELRPQLQKRNDVYKRWLASGKERDLMKFRAARNDVRRSIRAAKNNWFKAKALEIEGERFGGKKVWKCIRDMQLGRRGRVPVRMSTIRDENGEPCTTQSEQQQRWRRHFTKVLNVVSQFDKTELDEVKQRKTDTDLGTEPTSAEVARALNKLKNGKAPGSSNILPEMLKAGCRDREFLEMIANFIHAIWEEKRVPKEWVDAVLIPIPKKGNLQICDNWRGIALLEAVGKVVARIIQGRLQKLAERELPESQCGFRKGRGCTDMIFTVRQLTEKAIEHQAKQFFVFVDLKKAYDTVPRDALWLALRKLGLPNILIDIIRSFHDNMNARIKVDGELLEEIEVNNGLRQGCTMAPTLFNLYACVVTERWLSRVKEVEDVGTCLMYKLDQQLFRRYTKNASEDTITQCQFADDVALLATTRKAAEEAIKAYSSVTKSLGLTVNITKTKFMAVGHDVSEEDSQPIRVEGGEIEHVNEFSYLGSTVATNGRIDAEIDKRIASASKAFGALRRAVFKDNNLSITTKRLIYQACVLSILLYGGECWTPLRRHYRKLNTFHHRCIRIILGITHQQQWEEHISSEKTREQWGDEDTITIKLLKRRLEWLGHLARMPPERIPKITLFSWLPQNRPQGGPRRRWRDLVKKDLKATGLRERGWYEEALHRKKWYQIYNEGLLHHQHERRRENKMAAKNIKCSVCGRCFRRELDKARHKCTAERQKPVQEQAGAVECPRCGRWLKSRGGLAVHRCASQHNSSNSDREHLLAMSPTLKTTLKTSRRKATSSAGTTALTEYNCVICTECGRKFSRPSDKKRHKCLIERAKPVEEQRSAVKCRKCQKWFCSKGGLAVHKCRPV